MEISETEGNPPPNKDQLALNKSPFLLISSSSDTSNTAGFPPPEPGPPHEAHFLALAYLPLFELLAMAQVCVSLRDWVKEDVLPWLNVVVVDTPLNRRLTDETFMRIASVADGKLTTLALINCAKISDHGLQWIVERNPLIDKLFIPGCTGLTPEGVIRAAKTLTQRGHRLKNLWINGIYNIEKHHLQELHSCLQNNPTEAHQTPWPFLFHEYKNFSRLRHHEDQPMTDMGICPRCEEARMVFECPRESCEKKKMKSSVMGCRGCMLCIPRCKECGGCVVESEGLEEEAVCTDTLCSDCWRQLPKCSFCNKPYCKQHAAEKRLCSSGSAGFVCDVCDEKFIGGMNYDDEA